MGLGSGFRQPLFVVLVQKSRPLRQMQGDTQGAPLSSKVLECDRGEPF